MIDWASFIGENGTDYLKTEEGNEVYILSVNGKGHTPIIGQVKVSGEWYAKSWTLQGKGMFKKDSLVIVPKRIQKYLVVWLCSDGESVTCCTWEKEEAETARDHVMELEEKGIPVLIRGTLVEWNQLEAAA